MAVFWIINAAEFSKLVFRAPDREFQAGIR
jgi:hypothetical protein